jgi:hypothetical protein
MNPRTYAPFALLVLSACHRTPGAPPAPPVATEAARRAQGPVVPADPAIAMDASGVSYLAWLGAPADPPGEGPTGSRVYVSRVEPHGNAAAALAPVDVSDQMRPTAQLAKPRVAVTADGAVVVTWSYAGPLGGGLGLARSTDGVAWTKQIVLERGDLHATLPFTCASRRGDRLWLVYLDAEAGVRIRASDDGGATWTPLGSATVSTSDERTRVASDTPVCAGDGDELTVAYGLTDSPTEHATSAIAVVRSSDRGASFDSRRTLDLGASRSSTIAARMARTPDGAIDLAFYAARAVSASRAPSEPSAMAVFVKSSPPTSTPRTNTWGNVAQPDQSLIARRFFHSEK